jgi:hypothetical protein
MISIATKHPVEYGSTMSMTDCAVVTDEEEEDMLMLVGCVCCVDGAGCA